MQVFYGNDCLPYKDSARSVHYPIVGNSFVGASNTTQIRFYVRDIGGVNNVSWVAIAKLPNGKISSQVLSSVHLDSELDEYYVAFDLSSYYTQVKGDVFISLNGYQGGVQIEQDEETDIYTVVGTPVIEATGSIKLAVNYAPQLPLGQHFNISDLQQVLGALSNKANVVNTVQVINDISQADLSGYDNGQLFYSLAQKLYYKKVSSSPYYELADNGILASDKVLYRIAIDSSTTINDLATVTNNYTKLLIANYQSQDYLLGISKIGETYNVVIIMFNFGSNDPLLIFKGGTLDNTQTVVSFISNDKKVVYVKQTNLGNKVYVTTAYGEQFVLPYDINAEGGTIVLRGGIGEVNVPITPLANSNATSKKYVDDIESALRDLIDTLVRNSYINVDTTEYPTLQDFLDSDGEEGHIYLYPIDTSDLTKGYYQYIWEYIEQDDEYEWQDLGTTQIDLSNYYTKPEANAKFVEHRNQSGNNAYVNVGGTDTLMKITSNAEGGIASRDNNGNLKVADPIVDAHATTKSYVDTVDATKVDKTNSSEKVYGTDELGDQTTYDVDSDLVGNGSVVRRESGTGTIVVGTPTSNTHATTKQYVDNSISNAISNVYKIKGSKTVAQINALTGMSVGDVYNVTDSGTITLGDLQVFTGDNIVWTGSAWDKLGAEIDWSAYDEKFMAAGFFEVQNYNESTGEVTIVYATDLYDMSYNGDTGVMTIEAN